MPWSTPLLMMLTLTLMLTSKGVAAVPRPSLVILAGTPATFNLPDSGTAVLLGADAVMEMACTSVNLLGNYMATAAVARWEGLDTNNPHGRHSAILPGTRATFKVSKQFVQNEARDFRFLEPGELRDDHVVLHLVATQPADPTRNWVPYYVFHILSEKAARRAGEIHLRVGNTEHMRLYGGHVAYGVRPEFRGNHFAARALTLLLPLARRHGLTELWVTCNPENLASRRTCELAGAELIEIVDLPPYVDMYHEGERQKCRYRLNLLKDE